MLRSPAPLRLPIRLKKNILLQMSDYTVSKCPSSAVDSLSYSFSIFRYVPTLLIFHNVDLLILM